MKESSASMEIAFKVYFPVSTCGFSPKMSSTRGTAVLRYSSSPRERRAFYADSERHSSDSYADRLPPEVGYKYGRQGLVYRDRVDLSNRYIFPFSASWHG